MKSNISKNARTDRRSAKKLEFGGKEIEPLLIKGDFTGIGSFMSAMYCESKQPIQDKSGNFMTWSQILDLIAQGNKSNAG